MPSIVPTKTHLLSDLVEEFVVCPECRSRLLPSANELFCTSCDFVGGMDGSVVAVGRRDRESYFDTRFGLMRRGHAENSGEWKLCYEQQLHYIESFLTPGTVVLDVGCGPDILYRRDPRCTLIGLDASYRSIQCNRSVDLAVHCDAARLPLRDRAMDSIVCLYSLHHMTGQTRAENVALVRRAFEEFARTLKPGGHLFVTEVLPWAVASGLQFLVWDVARRWLGPTLDQYFWQRASLVQLAAEILGPCRLETFTARTAPGLLVPPVFSLPWLKIPRALYPFEGTLFHWQRASS